MIPLVDLRAQYRGIRREVEPAVRRVLAGGRYTGGPETALFEKEFAAFCGAKHAVTCNSGTSALKLALEALGIGPGDEVIIPAMTFVATAAVILRLGARPVPVDIVPGFHTIDPQAVERKITRRTRALVPVHLYGQAAGMDALASIAHRHGLAVVEDAAQAHGARFRGQRTGTLGDAGCFSFYPSKNLGACGEGGVLVTDRADVAEKTRRARNWGMDENGLPTVPGDNNRLDELQAAILRVKLRHLVSWNRARREIARFYGLRLRGMGLDPPRAALGNFHVYHIYALEVPDRDRVRAGLLGHGVRTGVHYFPAVHLAPPLGGLGFRPGDFPRAERLARREVSLPIYPELGVEGAARVVAALGAVLGRGKG